MRDPFWIWLGALVVMVIIAGVYLLVTERRHARQWAEEDRRVRERLKLETEVVDYVEARRGSIRAGARRGKARNGQS